MDEHRIRLRDAGLRRLRRLTTTAAAGAGVLALIFAGLAAKAFPGRSSHATARSTTPVTQRRPTQSAPPVVSIGSPSPSAPKPASAPTPPATASAAPTVVSGGS